jgi:hypothetical protein
LTPLAEGAFDQIEFWQGVQGSALCTKVNLVCGTSGRARVTPPASTGALRRFSASAFGVVLPVGLELLDQFPAIRPTPVIKQHLLQLHFAP